MKYDNFGAQLIKKMFMDLTLIMELKKFSTILGHASLKGYDG
jgi:hypothetical protein